MKNKVKDTSFAFRIAKDDLNTIRKKANQAEMSVTDFFTKSALEKEIVVIDNLYSVINQLKAIGNNLNQLTMLSNMGNISTVNLDKTNELLFDIHKQILKLTVVVL